MDVRMPGLGGVETVRRLLSADPGARIIMLTVAEDLDGVALAVAAGARGYLHKDASRAELRATVTQALADPTWRLAPRRLRSAEMGAAPTLTAREIQVLEGMSHGRSNAEIGRELFLSDSAGALSAKAHDAPSRGHSDPRPPQGGRGCGRPPVLVSPDMPHP
jgi:DNA-binding NarL/FixJ family response regulator